MNVEQLANGIARQLVALGMTADTFGAAELGRALVRHIGTQPIAPVKAALLALADVIDTALDCDHIGDDGEGYDEFSPALPVSYPCDLNDPRN